MISDEIQRQINKRLTLNTLIQGAATHAFASAHHLAKSDFDQLDPELVPHYDVLMAASELSYWRGGLPMIVGSPTRYWKRLKKPTCPYRNHPFFLEHGPTLAMAARDRVFKRGTEHGLSLNGIANEIKLFKMIQATFAMEAAHLQRLEEIGINVCSEIYGISPKRLNAEITMSPKWGDVRPPQTIVGKLILPIMVGWGGVIRVDDKLQVMAKAIIWPLLLHELVKGTVELICLHGMTDLEDADFESVMDATEILEYEIPMIQMGGELYRRFLAVTPREIPLAESIMNVARMDPKNLDAFLFAVMGSQNRATEMLRRADG